MYLCETFFVIGDSVNKIELFLPSVEVVQTGLVHSELHVWFPIRLSMNDEYNLIAPVGNKVMETQVSQGYDIGDDLFQPKTSTFSTRALIWVHFKTMRYFSQSIFSLFSYLKNA